MGDIDNIIRLAALNDAEPEWLNDCIKSNDRPLAILANVMIALRADPAVKDCLAYDEMFCGPILLRPTPESIITVALPRPSHRRRRLRLCRSGCSMPVCRASARTWSIRPWTCAPVSAPSIRCAIT